MRVTGSINGREYKRHLTGVMVRRALEELARA